MSRLLPPPWELRPIAYRVSPLPRPVPPTAPPVAWPGMALVIETAAREELSGPPRVGAYLLCQGERVLARGLFEGAGLIDGDSQALARVSSRMGLEAPLTLEGLLELVYRYAYKKRLPLVAFNLPSQLCRLAADWTAVAPVRRRKNARIRRRQPDKRRRSSVYAGGVSLILWTTPAPPRLKRGQRRLRNGTLENGFRPRVLCKLLGDGTVFLDFAGPGKPDAIDLVPEGGPKAPYSRARRHLLPLERLFAALTGSRTRSLSAACAYFAIDCPDEVPSQADLAGLAEGCLARCQAAHRLYLTLLERHNRLRLPVAADRVASTASYAKATLDAIGITPPLQRYQGDPAGLGAAACAAYGGWSGVGIRCLPGSPPVPVRLVDAVGMYPVNAHSLGIWRLLTAERLTLAAAEPAEVEEWISRQRPEAFTLTPELNVFCRLAPRGDVLPHRIQPGATWLTTVAPLTCEQPLWWPLPDLVRSYFETGVVPKIDACLRLAGSGTIPDLKPVELPGLGRFDPNQPDADFFLYLAAGRQRLEAGESSLEEPERARLAGIYKLWDNSACSGIYLEVHPEEPSQRARTGTVVGPDGSYQTKAHAFEQMGRWYFPPFYSLVTSAARLLLHLAMRDFHAVGATVAYWDTDSLATVATSAGGPVPAPGGGSVRALSYAEVDAVCQALERHSPYPPNPDRRRDAVPSRAREPARRNRPPLRRRQQTEDPVHAQARRDTAPRFPVRVRPRPPPPPRRQPARGQELDR